MMPRKPKQEPDYKKPSWPAAGRFDPHRVYAALVANATLLTEHGELLDCNSYEQLREIAFREKLIVFVDDMSSFPWLLDAVEDAHARVICNDHGAVRMIRMTHKRSSAMVLDSSRWGYAAREVLLIMRRLMTLCQCGDYATPAQLGQAIMRRRFPRPAAGHPRTHSRPNRRCVQDLRDGLVGGRVDTILPGQIFDELIELDVNGAYLARCVQLPAGQPSRIEDDELLDSDDYVTAYMQCWITIRKASAPVLGPFPKRGRRRGALDLMMVDGSDNVTYPVRPGRYKSWLWYEEIAVARSAGCEVVPIQGWAWLHWTSCLEGWATHMYTLRQRAADDPPVQQLCKLAGVAALGRFGCGVDDYELSTEQTEESTPYFDSYLGATELHIIHSERDDGGQQPHWYSYVMMQQRLALYRKALPYMRSGQLVATNYDSVYIIPHGTAPSSRRGLGQWKTAVHAGPAGVPYPRGFISRSKISLPGLAHDSKERAELIKTYGITTDSP